MLFYQKKNGVSTFLVTFIIFEKNWFDAKKKLSSEKKY